MNNKNTINCQATKLSSSLDSLGLVFLTAICAGYFLFSRRFAEMHINLPFLDFPVFVGEIMLFICLLLLGLKWLVKYKEKNEKICPSSFIVRLLFGGYAIFILAKAFYGYAKWGPLAFRDAALFYYPIYAIFGYVFYKKDFFKGLRTVFFVLLLCGLFITKFDFYGYFGLSVFFLAIILIMKYPRKYIKYALFIILSLAFDYKGLALTSRTMLVGNIAAIVFVASALLFILKIRKRYKFIALGALFLFITLGFIKMADKSAVYSLSRLAPGIKLYREYKDKITKIAPTFKMQEVKKLVLYNPEEEIDKKVPVFFTQNVDVKIKEAKEKLIATDAILNKAGTIIDKKQPASSEVEAKFLLEQAHISLNDTSTKIEEIRSQVNVLKDAEAKSLLGQEQVLHTHQADQPFHRQSKSKIKGSLSSLQILQDKIKVLDLTSKELYQKAEKTGKGISAKYGKRAMNVQYNNMLFRVFIWEDMIRELWRAKPILGFDFGKPLRSKNIEILDIAHGEWSRDGWIAPHNSYLHIIYRAGIIGIAYIILIMVLLFSMINKSLKLKSISGVLLCGILINWLAAANFLVILELPYNAILFWSLFGLSYAYLFKTKAD